MITRRVGAGGASTGAAGAAATGGFSSAGAFGAGGGVVTADFGIASPAFGGAMLTALGAFAIAGFSGSAAGFFSALRTSPGLEIFEKSNFGLISSPFDFLSAPDEPLLPPKRCLRTRSASSSSKELEWVFFSVTPTSGSTSRIALLLTSSSLARSLIRTFDIRPR
jgi:hypothetical protein